MKTFILWAWLFGGATVSPDAVIGYYDVTGTGDRGDIYHIVAEVREIHGALHVRWTYAPGDHSFGHGFLDDDGRFVVGFYGRLTGAAVYERTKDGWRGVWSHDGMRYPERWTRRAGPTPEQQDEAPAGEPGPHMEITRPQAEQAL